MSAVEVTFVRHGESVSNVSGRWQGQGDAPLSEVGREQARALAERLRTEPFDVVVASDLSRARDTAQAVFAEVELDPSWREIDVGRWEGLAYAEAFAKYPDELERIRRGEPVKIGGGESWEDLHARVDAALERLRARLAPGQRALVVSHGGVIIGLTSGVLHSRSRRLQPFGRMVNTGVTTLRHEGGRWVVTRYNDSTHLAPVGALTSEQHANGDTVLALVGFDGAADAPDEGGRMRGGALAAAEQLASWYPELEAVYAHPERGPRNFAAVFATRHGQNLRELPGASPAELGVLVDALVAAHPGDRIGLVAPVQTIAAYAESLLPPAPHEGPRVLPPEHGSVTHVVATPKYQSVMEYNLRGR